MTAFEFVSADLGSQDALGGGGRYDGLVEQLGGKPTSAVGFAAGIERLLMVMEKNEYEFPADRPLLYIVGMDERSRSWAFQAAVELRARGLRVEIDYAARSVKAQMREANRMESRYVIVAGESEMESGTVQVKHMAEGTQEAVEFDRIADYFLSIQN